VKPVRKVVFPAESRLAARLPRATFHDAFEAPLENADLIAAAIAAAALRASPHWVEALIRLRNAMSRPFGIRPVAPLGSVAARDPAAWRPGDGFGMFTIESIDDAELVLGIDDAHLDVRISFLRRPASYLISSLVITHNRVGVAYMQPVRLVHPLLVILLMRELPI